MYYCFILSGGSLGWSCGAGLDNLVPLVVWPVYQNCPKATPLSSLEDNLTLTGGLLGNVV